MSNSNMSQSQIIESLKLAAQKDKATDAVLHVFAMRERARAQVTMSALEQKMRAERFSFDRQDYVRVLKLLAELGLGRLDTDTRGRVRALKDIKTSLQSIGAAACGQSTKLDRFKMRNKFSKITAGVVKEKLAAPVEVPAPQKEAGVTAIGLTVSINGKMMTVSVPKDLTAQEIALLVGRFQDKRSA